MNPAPKLSWEDYQQELGYHDLPPEKQLRAMEYYSHVTGEPMESVMARPQFGGVTGTMESGARTLLAGAYNTAAGGTLGMMRPEDFAADPHTQQVVSHAEAEHPVASTLGNLAGIGAGGYALAQVPGMAALSPLAQLGTEASMFTGSEQLGRYFHNEEVTPEGVLADELKNLALFGGFSLAGKAIGKGVGKLFSKGKPVNQELIDAMRMQVERTKEGEVAKLWPREVPSPPMAPPPGPQAPFTWSGLGSDLAQRARSAELGRRMNAPRVGSLGLDLGQTGQPAGEFSWSALGEELRSRAVGNPAAEAMNRPRIDFPMEGPSRPPTQAPRVNLLGDMGEWTAKDSEGLVERIARKKAEGQAPEKFPMTQEAHEEVAGAMTQGKPVVIRLSESRAQELGVVSRDVEVLGIKPGAYEGRLEDGRVVRIYGDNKGLEGVEGVEYRPPEFTREGKAAQVEEVAASETAAIDRFSKLVQEIEARKGKMTPEEKALFARVEKNPEELVEAMGEFENKSYAERRSIREQAELHRMDLYHKYTGEVGELPLHLDDWDVDVMQKVPMDYTAYRTLPELQKAFGKDRGELFYDLLGGDPVILVKRIDGKPAKFFTPHGSFMYQRGFDNTALADKFHVTNAERGIVATDTRGLLHELGHLTNTESMRRNTIAPYHPLASAEVNANLTKRVLQGRTILSRDTIIGRAGNKVTLEWEGTQSTIKRIGKMYGKKAKVLTDKLVAETAIRNKAQLDAFSDRLAETNKAGGQVATIHYTDMLQNKEVAAVEKRLFATEPVTNWTKDSLVQLGLKVKTEHGVSTLDLRDGTKIILRGEEEAQGYLEALQRNYTLEEVSQKKALKVIKEYVRC